MTADSKNPRIFAIGRRKTSSARIQLIPGGTGKIIINDRELSDYCCHEPVYKSAIAPLVTIDSLNEFDASVKVRGGGPNSQAGAISHSLARALEKFNPEWRIPLKRAGHLKRDPRQKERKKSGQPGARKRFQFSKR